MSKQSFIVMGGSDKVNGDYSRVRKLSANPSKSHNGWGCQKDTHKGDELWLYITAPISAIVAVGTALRDATPGNNWRYETKVGGVSWIEPHISKVEMERMFPNWKWAKNTRGNVQLDDRKATALRDRLAELRKTVASKKLNRGAGFGDAAQNRKVEVAAIRFVKRKYERKGYHVTSVESQNLGYDLHARRKKSESHIEVKGVSGNIPDFVITANELGTAKTDDHFCVAIVLNALTKTPEMHVLSGKIFVRAYNFKPVAYRANRK